MDEREIEFQRLCNLRSLEELPWSDVAIVEMGGWVVPGVIRAARVVVYADHPYEFWAREVGGLDDEYTLELYVSSDLADEPLRDWERLNKGRTRLMRVPEMEAAVIAAFRLGGARFQISSVSAQTSEGSERTIVQSIAATAPDGTKFTVGLDDSLTGGLVASVTGPPVLSDG